MTLRERFITILNNHEVQIRCGDQLSGVRLIGETHPNELVHGSGLLDALCAAVEETRPDFSCKKHGGLYMGCLKCAAPMTSVMCIKPGCRQDSVFCPVHSYQETRPEPSREALEQVSRVEQHCRTLHTPRLKVHCNCLKLCAKLREVVEAGTVLRKLYTHGALCYLEPEGRSCICGADIARANLIDALAPMPEAPDARA